MEGEEEEEEEEVVGGEVVVLEEGGTARISARVMRPVLTARWTWWQTSLHSRSRRALRMSTSSCGRVEKISVGKEGGGR
jgi:hypothetical protein